ncbi:MAG: ribbon-helix-helix domain-containing protein [Deltaproteobacteria bacterium]|nr:ribbon-helix-helix domain-containing protein [Deltaproteobacteria bacterium]
MIRTQVQLSEAQLEALKAIAARWAVPIAELVRRGVDRVIAAEQELSMQERRRRARASFGKFRSGKHDLAERHDGYLAEAFEEDLP